MNCVVRLAVAMATLLALASPSLAQSYPNRSITLIVPFAPGGPADVLGRLIGQKMSEDLGQQVVIDNRSGANTIIGAQAVANAKPDGYTILLAIDGTLVMNPFLYSKLAYDPFKDFEPVSLVALVPSAITASMKNPANSLKEVIDIEKAKPGTFQVGVSTPTSQVALGLLNMMAGTNIVMVPYRGGTTQITEHAGGRHPARPRERQRGAAALSREQDQDPGADRPEAALALAPEIPLSPRPSRVRPRHLAERRGAGRHAARRSSTACSRRCRRRWPTPDLREKLTAAGIEPTISKSPEDFGAFIKSQAEVREKVIKAVEMKLD